MPPIEILDVSPRDGLQSEHEIVATDTKVELIRRLHAAGVQSLETSSFVNPKRVPQMADSADVVAGVNALNSAPGSDIHQIGLALNVMGCERAIAAGVDEVGFVLVSTDTFSQRNQGAPVSASVAVWREIHALCRAANVRCNVLIGAAFGCPFEGDVSADHVLNLIEQLLETPPDVIGVADSIGVAVPVQIKKVIQGVGRIAGDLPVRCHLHDTRNTGIANALTAIESGATFIDASTGGIGGCPFAPAATGNIATEDLLYAMSRSGIETTVDIDKILETAAWLEEALAHPVPSSLLRAGPFPAKVA